MDAETTKQTRFRSVAYPSYTIAYCVELTKKINTHFGAYTFTSREDISKELQIPVGTLLMQLSSATQYNLLEMKSKEGYKPTDIFKKIYKPLNETEKKTAEIQALISPPLYLGLIEKFRGKQLPAVGGLAILLYRNYKVAEDASSKAARIFLENLEHLKVIDEENVLRDDFNIIDDDPLSKAVDEGYTGTVYNGNQLDYNQQPKNELPKNDTVIDVTSQLVDAPAIPIFFEDGTIGKVLLPMNFTDKHLDRVIKVLSVYKRE